MKHLGRILGLFLLCSHVVYVHAEELSIAKAAQPSQEQTQPLATTSPLSATPQFQLAFMGSAVAENGDTFYYFLQVQKNQTRLFGEAVLIGQQHQVLLHIKEQATSTEETPHQWRVGSIFLRFNPITTSWVFGVKKSGHHGFNFKVDSLAQEGNASTKQIALRKGIEVSLTETNRLNGHVVFNESETEQFVTAKHAWLEQFWLSQPQNVAHEMASLWCEQEDGTRFYFINMPEEDADQAAIAGWLDAEGHPERMSQFVTLAEDKKGQWHIGISSPSHHFVFDDVLHDKEKSLYIGTLSEGKSKGMCTLNRFVFEGAH